MVKAGMRGKELKKIVFTSPYNAIMLAHNQRRHPHDM